ncbi:unnamed protein product [Rhizophagus irregularis]|nr:unnamed protein product [Rhizophagus irregularis]CAB5393946.1 unnamed protein product [Rhizophagus irregularis]
MTWTTELKTLADKIFGNQASKDIEIRPIGATDTTSPEDDNNEIQIDEKKQKRPFTFLTKLLILSRIDVFK